jgi:hypothetical protein
MEAHRPFLSSFRPIKTYFPFFDNNFFSEIHTLVIFKSDKLSKNCGIFAIYNVFVNLKMTLLLYHCTMVKRYLFSDVIVLYIFLLP